MSIEVIRADYKNPQHASDLVTLLGAYALDPMGGGSDLSNDVKQNLPLELSKRPFAFSFLAYFDKSPAGLVNGFEGFSTFKARPLINIHDIVVHPDYRGKGISQNLLEAVEREAKSRKACKITLEVLSGNAIAQNAYKKFGFNGYELDPTAGQALFWEKPL